MASSGGNPGKSRTKDGDPGKKKNDGNPRLEIVAGIRSCDKELDQLDLKMSEELLLVQYKYNKLTKPFFDRRATLIGEIPGFWGDTLLQHPKMGKLIEARERGCFLFLEKLEVEEFEDGRDGFRIKFTFEDDNPYFTNKELVKEFDLGRHPEAESTSSSTGINWKKWGIVKGLQSSGFFSWFSDNRKPDKDTIAEVITDDLWISPVQYFLRGGRDY